MGFLFEQLVRVPEIPARDLRLDPRPWESPVCAPDVALRCGTGPCGEDFHAGEYRCRAVRRRPASLGARCEAVRCAAPGGVGDGAEWQMVFVEWKMERRREGRAGAV